MPPSLVVIDLTSDAPPRVGGQAHTAIGDEGPRPWYKLSLPGAQSYHAFSQPARDPLRCWPDVYDPMLDTSAWASAKDWRGVKGFQKNVKSDVGFEPATVNYAFNYLYDHIPSGCDQRHGYALLFDVRNEAELDRKCRNFYGALKYIHHYPIAERMGADLGCSSSLFYEQMLPTIYSMAAHIDFMDFNLRLWDYNHTEHFPERVLMSWDGFPIRVACSSNRWVARLTKSKKYQDWVVKADLGIMLGPGFPIDYSLQLGVRNDSRMWMEHPRRRARMFPWEYALGDKAYVGCPEFLTEYKGRNLQPDQRRWNNTLQFYRGRNEHQVMEVKTGRQSLDTRWRGSFAGLASVVRIVMHMVALQERMKGPKYDCFGPWPVCPNSIVSRYV